MFAAVVGLGHAFKPDHLLAVSTLVTRYDRLGPALRDGLFWGLGHTTMLLLFGSVVVFSRAAWLHSAYFEAAVGVMLVGLGSAGRWTATPTSRFRSPGGQRAWPVPWD